VKLVAIGRGAILAIKAQILFPKPGIAITLPFLRAAYPTAATASASISLIGAPLASLTSFMDARL
jgi:hypothetical protein